MYKLIEKKPICNSFSFSVARGRFRTSGSVLYLRGNSNTLGKIDLSNFLCFSKLLFKKID